MNITKAITENVPEAIATLETEREKLIDALNVNAQELVRLQMVRDVAGVATVDAEAT